MYYFDSLVSNNVNTTFYKTTVC